MKKTLYFLAAVLSMAGCDDFFVRDISGETVEIVAPTDGASITEGDATFCWNVVRGAESYRLTIVSPSFAEAVSTICDVIVVPDSAAVGCLHTETLLRGDYQWSLTGLNSEYTTVRTIYALTVLEAEQANR